MSGTSATRTANVTFGTGNAQTFKGLGTLDITIPVAADGENAAAHAARVTEYVNGSKSLLAKIAAACGGVALERVTITKQAAAGNGRAYVHVAAAPVAAPVAKAAKAAKAAKVDNSAPVASVTDTSARAIDVAAAAESAVVAYLCANLGVDSFVAGKMYAAGVSAYRAQNAARCNGCNGTGALNLAGKQYPCPACNGTGIAAPEHVHDTPDDLPF